MLSLRRGPQTPEALDEPVELLLACHGRIRRFCETARRLANGSGAPVEQVAEAAASLERYFSVALPLHERDEEDSLAPRLLESGARSEVEQALSRMADEHRVIDGAVEQLVPVWKRVAVRPPELEAAAEELLEGAEALASLFETHLALEEDVIFPAVARALSAATRASIVREMRARREPDGSLARMAIE